MNKNISKGNASRSNFGLMGWFIIIFAFFSFMFAGNLIVDSLNVTIGAFSLMHGWNIGTLLTYSTVGSLISIISSGILSVFVSKYGVKIIYSISLAIVAMCCMFWGSITSLYQYAVIVILVNIFGNGFGFIGGTAILSNWFPKKKGLAMGWATIGFQASAVILLPFYQFMLEKYDLATAYRVVGAGLFVLLFICIVFVKNDPEDRGCTPDNDNTLSIEQYRKLHEKALKFEKENHLSVIELVKTKQMWHIGLINGLVQLAITVLIVQFIPNLAGCGFSQSEATLLYSVASIVGGIGSYLWGVLDHRVGVKRASMWMCMIHAIAAALFALSAINVGGKTTAILAAFAVGSILGVSSNYVGSFTAQVFGRYGYASAFAAIYMVVTALRSLGYMLIGVINTATGSNFIAYIISALLSLLALIITFKTDDRCINAASNMMSDAENYSTEE